MRVLNLVTRLNIGGASPMVLGLTTGLKRRGHTTLLAVGTPQPGEGTLEDEARREGADVIRIPALVRNPHPVRDAAALVAIVRLFRAWKPDIVATHMSKAGALGRIAGRMSGVPVVHTYHGKGFHVFDSWLKMQLALNAERCLARLAAGTIVVSEVQRREFEMLGVGRPDRQRVIHYGLQLDPFLEAAEAGAPLREELHLAPATRLVGVVGRVVAIKGQDVFLRAAASLADAYPDVQFVIVGDGDARTGFESLALELGVSSRVRFLGWRRDIPQVLASLDVVVLPTVLDFEGVPVAVIEAMAARRAIVATNVGGVAEVIEDGITGRLVPPRDVPALAEAVASLLDGPEAAARMAAAGQALARRLFDIERFLVETEQFLSELVGERSGAPVSVSGRT